MEWIALVALLLGVSWSSGINLYLTIAFLGISHHMGWMTLPGDLHQLAHPLVIGVAAFLFLVEFFADKIPYVDSAWDGVHTFVRPVGGAVLAYLAVSEGEAVAQTVAALAGGAIAFDSHMVKAGTRAMINTSPEPVSNSAASITEDGAVLGVLWTIATHPLITIAVVAVFAVLSVWLFPRLIRFVSRRLRALKKKRDISRAAPDTAAEHKV